MGTIELIFNPPPQIWTTPLSRRQAERVAEALALIGPATELRAGCEEKVAWALKTVRFYKAFDKKFVGETARAALKRGCLKDATQLRQAADILDSNFRGSAEIDRTVVSARKSADFKERIGLSIDVSKGAPSKKYSKTSAVRLAWWLLADFGRQRPGLTDGGVWHQLAEILCGHPVSFDYLRYERKRLKNDKREFLADL